MCEIVAILLASCSVLFGITDCTTSFDQRQTGDLNVQIGLKNIQLIALLNSGSEDYVDYDYAYDYSEMTIKPQNGTTPKPLNVTQSQSYANSSSTSLANHTIQSNVTIIGIRINDTIHDNSDQTNATISIINATKPEPSITHNTQSENNIKESTDNIPENINTVRPSVPIQTTNMDFANDTHITTIRNILTDLPTTISPIILSDVSEPTTVPANHCRRGFVRNNQGKCEYKIHGTSNALRRIVKLAQKIKIGRGITET